MDEPVLSNEATLDEDALRVPVDDFRSDFKKLERFDESSITDGCGTLNDSTAKASDQPVQPGAFVEIHACEIQFA